MRQMSITESYASSNANDSSAQRDRAELDRLAARVESLGEEIRCELARQTERHEKRLEEIRETIETSSKRLYQNLENRPLPSPPRRGSGVLLLVAGSILLASLLVILAWPTTRAPIARALLSSEDRQTLALGEHLLTIYPRLIEPRRRELRTLLSLPSETSTGSGNGPSSPSSTGPTAPLAPDSTPKRSPAP